MHAGCTLTQVYNLSIDAMGGGATSNGRRNQLPVPWGKAVGILDNFLFGPFLLRIYCSNLATEWENSFKITVKKLSTENQNFFLSFSSEEQHLPSF